MIKLVVSDVDGTLVPEGTSDVNPELIAMIRRIQQQGVRFAAASGRQYSAILTALGELSDEILFIADNGAYIIEHDRPLFTSVLKPSVWKEMVRFIHTVPNADIMLSSVEGTFTDSPKQWFSQLLWDGYGLRLEPVRDLTAMDLNVTKIGVYLSDANPVQIARLSEERFGEDANILVSGECWMDYVPKDADKGLAVARIQEHMGISAQETMAFGDNNNDIGMLLRAGESYAVANARQEVKEAAGHIMEEGAGEDGVLHILQRFWK